MKKFFKWTLIVVASLVVLIAVAITYLNYQNRKKSPPGTATYDKDGTQITVTYSRPSKRGRVIFGELVPYGKVWRTGANEATTFESNKDLSVAGKTLLAGKYTLWTIPEKDKWTVIFNNKQYGWGIRLMSGEASREPEADALLVQVPAEEVNDSVEQFTIVFDESNGLALVLAWDKTKVAVPIK